MNILDPQGPIGVADRAILIDSLAIMLAVVLPTIIAIFGFAYWFWGLQHKSILLARLGVFGTHRSFFW